MVSSCRAVGFAVPDAGPGVKAARRAGMSGRGRARRRAGALRARGRAEAAGSQWTPEAAEGHGIRRDDPYLPAMRSAVLLEGAVIEPVTRIRLLTNPATRHAVADTPSSVILIEGP